MTCFALLPYCCSASSLRCLWPILAFCFFFFGGKEPTLQGWASGGDASGARSNCMCHNTAFDFNDNTIPIAATFYVRLVEDRLKGRATFFGPFAEGKAAEYGLDLADKTPDDFVTKRWGPGEALGANLSNEIGSVHRSYCAADQGCELFVLWGGIGLACLPIDLILAYVYRPVPMDAREIAEYKLQIQKRVLRDCKVGSGTMMSRSLG